MKKIFKGALNSSLVVTVFGLMFHYQTANPHDWAAVAFWLPIYLLPIWVIALGSYLSERKKNRNN